MPAARAQQVAALPWRRRNGGIEILLVTSRGTRRWVIPKGWRMAHLVDPNAAKLEAYEEAGIDGRIRRKPVGRYTYSKRGADGEHQPCLVTVYALGVARQFRAWPERGERTRRWFPAREAALQVHEPGLRALIRRFAG